LDALLERLVVKIFHHADDPWGRAKAALKRLADRVVSAEFPGRGLVDEDGRHVC